MSGGQRVRAHALLLALIAGGCSGPALRTSDPANDPVSPAPATRPGAADGPSRAATPTDPEADFAAPQDAHRAPPATTATSSANAPEREPPAPAGTTRDAQIVRELERALASTPSLSLAARSVKITCRDGKLVLSGTVQSPAERDTLERAAQQLRGVRQIDSRLSIEP